MRRTLVSTASTTNAPPAVASTIPTWEKVTAPPRSVAATMASVIPSAAVSWNSRSPVRGAYSPPQAASSNTAAPNISLFFKFRFNSSGSTFQEHGGKPSLRATPNGKPPDAKPSRPLRSVHLLRASSQSFSHLSLSSSSQSNQSKRTVSSNVKRV